MHEKAKIRTVIVDPHVVQDVGETHTSHLYRNPLSRDGIAIESPSSSLLRPSPRPRRLRATEGDAAQHALAGRTSSTPPRRSGLQRSFPRHHDPGQEDHRDRDGVGLGYFFLALPFAFFTTFFFAFFFAAMCIPFASRRLVPARRGDGLRFAPEGRITVIHRDTYARTVRAPRASSLAIIFSIRRRTFRVAGAHHRVSASPQSRSSSPSELTCGCLCIGAGMCEPDSAASRRVAAIAIASSAVKR